MASAASEFGRSPGFGCEGDPKGNSRSGERSEATQQLKAGSRWGIAYEQEQQTSTDFARGHSRAAFRNDNHRTGVGRSFLTETLWPGVGDDLQHAFTETGWAAVLCRFWPRVATA